MRRSGRTAAGALGAAGCATLAAAAAAALAQDPGGPSRPRELGPLPQVVARWTDAAADPGALEFSDLASLALAAEGADLVFHADLRRELVDGMFSCLELEYDCDGRRADAELATRAAVGSRYRPTAFLPRAGEARPLDLVRASWQSPFDELRPDSAVRDGMTNIAPLAVPQVGGRGLRFRLPQVRLTKRGARGATTPPAFRAKLVTSCADHPVAFDYDAVGRGREIAVDGDADEWSGGPYVEDPGGELHSAARRMDLRAVWCEHGPDRLFLRVDFDAPGFGVALADPDVDVLDTLRVEVQPFGEAYMADVVAAIPAQRPTGTAGAVTWSAGDGCVEIAVTRDPKQTRFRVAVWSEALRVDELSGAWIPFPAESLR